MKLAFLGIVTHRSMAQLHREITLLRAETFESGLNILALRGELAWVTLAVIDERVSRIVTTPSLGAAGSTSLRTTRADGTGVMRRGQIDHPTRERPPGRPSRIVFQPCIAQLQQQILSKVVAVVIAQTVDAADLSNMVLDTPFGIFVEPIML